MIFFHFVTIDPSLGRVDKSMLSEQTLIELLTDKITNREVISGDVENIKPIDKWVGSDIFEGIILDANENVTSIGFPDDDLTGSLQLEWMPELTRSCDFSRNNLSGTIDLEHLPRSLRRLYLSLNSFVGSVSLTQLPILMIYLRLDTNQLSGTIDLTSLPDHLEQLDLSENFFSGRTDFSRLPHGLRNLNVSRTHVKGEVWVPRTSKLKVLGVPTYVLKKESMNDGLVL